MPLEPMARIPESDRPLMKPSVFLGITLTEENYQGLYSLMQWVDGFKAASKADVPGSLHLADHLLVLTQAIQRVAEDKQKDCKHESWVAMDLGYKKCKRCGYTVQHRP